MFAKDWSEISQAGILQGYDWLVWTIIVCNATGGLIIAVVMKYADNILKAYAQSFAIILACLGSAFVFSFRPTTSFLNGTCLVILSIFLYAKFPHKVKQVQLVTVPKSKTVITCKDPDSFEYTETLINSDTETIRTSTRRLPELA